jgi:hypothetical protein
MLVLFDLESYLASGQQWKQGQWSKDEVELLQANIVTFCKVSTQ